MLAIMAATSSNAAASRNVYIDVGANWANTLRLYHDVVKHFKLKPRAAPWEVYAFEASPYIQPYVEAFVEHLNSRQSAPCLTVPPAGSTWTLAQYAYHFGCCAGSEGSGSWHNYTRHNHCHFSCCDTVPAAGTSPGFAECMYQLFESPISNLVSSPVLNDSALVTRRMREASRAPSHLGHGETRYTFVPAAAGSATGTLELQGVSRFQMLHGGGSSKRHPLTTSAEDVRMRVQLADIAGFVSQHFAPNDLVVLKLDCEGAEFDIIRKLLREGTLRKIDVLLMECHSWAERNGKKSCQTLEHDMLAAHPQLLMYKETWASHSTPIGRGYDSHSAPSDRMPVDPRRPMPPHCTYQAGFDAGFRAALRSWRTRALWSGADL